VYKLLAYNPRRQLIPRFFFLQTWQVLHLTKRVRSSCWLLGSQTNCGRFHDKLFCIWNRFLEKLDGHERKTNFLIVS